MPIYKVAPVAWQKRDVTTKRAPSPKLAAQRSASKKSQKSQKSQKSVLYFPPAREELVDLGEEVPVQIRSRRSITSKPTRVVVTPAAKSPPRLKFIKSITTHRVVKRDRDSVVLWVSEALRPIQPIRDAVLKLMIQHGARNLSELRRLPNDQFEAFTVALFGKPPQPASRSRSRSVSKPASRSRSRSLSIPEVVETQVNLSKSKSVRIKSPSMRATTVKIIPKAASIREFEPVKMDIQRVKFGQPLIKRNWRDKQLVLDTVQVAMSSGSPILKQVLSKQMANVGVSTYAQLKQLPRAEFDHFAIAFFLTLEKLEKKS